jgi:hypothetical protein
VTHAASCHCHQAIRSNLQQEALQQLLVEVEAVLDDDAQVTHGRMVAGVSNTMVADVLDSMVADVSDSMVADASDSMHMIPAVPCTTVIVLHDQATKSPQCGLGW